MITPQRETKIILIRENVDSIDSVLSEFSNLSQNGKKTSFSYPSDAKLLDITPLFSSVFSGLNFKNQHFLDSYNCHNTSLVIQGFLKKQSYSSQDEILFYANNFCTETNTAAPLSMSLFTENRMSSHSYTNISDDIIFDKLSNSSKKTFSLRSGGRNNKFTHYQCDPSKFQSINCPEFQSIKKKVDEIDNFFSLVAVQINLATKRQSYDLKLESLEKELNEFHPMGRSCELLKEAAKLRINAIATFSESLRLGGIYKQLSQDTGAKF